jgi:hypothetical protein
MTHPASKTLEDIPGQNGFHGFSGFVYSPFHMRILCFLICSMAGRKPMKPTKPILWSDKMELQGRGACDASDPEGV